jgi:hypothetical protein
MYCTIPMLLYARSHGLRKILAMLKSSGLILQLSEAISLPVVGAAAAVAGGVYTRRVRKVKIQRS